MEHINKGTPVYSAYIGTNPELHWIDEGVISEIVFNGQPLVRCGDALVPYGKKWRLTKADARRDIHAALIRHIGKLQAEADKMADEILHEDLATEEVTRGVA